LIATDLIARGLDITNVRAVINFSFPTEPKRFLHRIGRTARAGQHGVAITLCNEEERKELKKLNRKLNQTLNTFTVQNKFVEPIFNKIKRELDTCANDILAELENEREMKEALKELKRSENTLKYKQEIRNRPRKEWFQSTTRRDTVKKDSKADLKSIKSNFEDNMGSQSHPKNNNNKNRKKRIVKQEDKAQAAQNTGNSKFGADKESNKGKEGKSRYAVGKNKEEGGAPAEKSTNQYFKKKKALGKRK
jgi:ATP-dependent RNA helicase DDX27